jgi:predicted PurR-regulated permease PerM
MSISEEATVVPRIWRNTLIVTLVIAFIFLRQYIMLIALAGLTAYLFGPLYDRMLRWTKKAAIAVPLTMLSAFLLILIPVSVVLTITVIEMKSIVTDIQSIEFQQEIDGATDSLKGFIETVNNLLSDSNEEPIDRDAIAGKIQEQLPKILNGAVSFITSTLGSIPRFFTFLILYLFLLGSMLVSKKKILNYIKALSPFNDRINEIYFRKIGLMTSAMVKGQFIIAVVQGLLGGLSLWIAGIDYIFFFTVLLIFMSFIPLGGGILTLPIAGILLLTGNIWQGLVVGLMHLVVITNVDGLLRVKLVHKEAWLPASLMLIATFAGVGFFGLIGVVYGPIIMILIMTTFSLYISENKRHKKPE